MPFDAKDPRASLTSAAGGDSNSLSEFVGAEYAKFYETDPDEASPHTRTWQVRGQNFIVAYAEASAEANFFRPDQIGKGINRLVDIFCPPRIDFSKKPGWVYPVKLITRTLPGAYKKSRRLRRAPIRTWAHLLGLLNKL